MLTRGFSAGITEVQIIQWYVEEGARVEEWKPLCQYQSDKAVDDVSLAFCLIRSGLTIC
jgi:2-oxoisovalerate dehydrogenase E2 component (dihydrolipoyl transacylase)